MARAKKLSSKPLPANRLSTLLDEFLEWMRVNNALKSLSATFTPSKDSTMPPSFSMRFLNSSATPCP